MLRLRFTCLPFTCLPSPPSVDLRSCLGFLDWASSPRSTTTLSHRCSFFLDDTRKMASSFREGGDIALWLHNKLGSTDDTWSSHTITGQLNPDVLRNIRKCYEALQPNVKVKILLSFLHLPRRQLDEPEWRQELNAIMETASHDTDQWVMMVADLMKTFPNYALFNLDEISDTAEEPFGDVLKELSKIVKKSTDRNSLPLEFQFLGKQALTIAAGHGLPGIQRHFTIKRKPKSAVLRAELLQKSDATKKTLGIGGGLGIPGVKSRNFNEKKGLLDSSLNKKSGSGAFFKSPTRNPLGVPARGSLASRNQSIGIKVLDIKDQPLSFKDARKRKKDEEEKEKKDRDAKKEKLAVPNASSEADPSIDIGQNGVKNGLPKTTENTTAAPKPTPDYAASLGLTSTLVPVTSSVSSSVLCTTPEASSEINVPSIPDYAPKTSSSIFLSTTDGAKPISASPTKMATVPQPTATRLTSPSASTLKAPASVQQTVNAQAPAQAQVQQAAQMQVNSNQTGLHAQQMQQMQVNSAPVGVANAMNVNQLVPTSAADAKKGLSLTKEQMLEAQEMFKTSNKVTRPEKALILGFMAGSRDNPCPEKGHILTIRLSEREEMVQPDSTKAAALMHVETYFQMNYETGDWKRIKKCRPIPATRNTSLSSDNLSADIQSQQHPAQQPTQQLSQQPPLVPLSSPSKNVISPGFGALLAAPSAATSVPVMYRAITAPTQPAALPRNPLPAFNKIRAPTSRTAAVASAPSSDHNYQGLKMIQASNITSTTPAKSAVAAPPAPYNANTTNAVQQSNVQSNVQQTNLQMSNISRILASQTQVRAPPPPQTTTSSPSRSLPSASAFLPAATLGANALRGFPQGTVLLRAPDGRIVQANTAAFALGAQALQAAPKQPQANAPRQLQPQQTNQHPPQAVAQAITQSAPAVQTAPPAHSSQAAQLRLVQQMQLEQQQSQPRQLPQPTLRPNALQQQQKLSAQSQPERVATQQSQQRQLAPPQPDRKATQQPQQRTLTQPQQEKATTQRQLLQHQLQQQQPQQQKIATQAQPRAQPIPVHSLQSYPQSLVPPRLIPASELTPSRSNSQAGNSPSTRPAPNPASSPIGQTQGDINSALLNRGVVAGASPLRFLVPGAGGGMVQLQQPLNAATIAALQRHQLQQLQLAQQGQTGQVTLQEDKQRR